MPTVQLQVNDAKSNIEELKEQNRLLNEIVSKLQTEISTRPTLTMVKQEISKYVEG